MADVTIRFTDGTTEEVFVKAPIGSLTNPLSESAQITKFLELTSSVLGRKRSDTLLSTIQAMDPDMKVGDLTSLYCL